MFGPQRCWVSSSYFMKPQDVILRRVGALMLECGEMQSFDRLISIAYHVLATEPLGGMVVEFGVYRGKTAAFIASMTNRDVHLFDSFEGLPEKGAVDVSPPCFRKGNLASTQEQVLETFVKSELKTPYLYKGWFSDFMELAIGKNISFAHLDGDYYQSILDGLAVIYPCLVPGATLLIDDYGYTDLPGVEAATVEFFKDKPEKVTRASGLNMPCCQAVVIKT